MSEVDAPRLANGRFAELTLEAVYAEIKRLDQLRGADQLAVQAALSAAEKAVAAALAASEKAVNKAEVAQFNVNTTQNEFRGSLKDQAQTLMPRNEAENIFRELRGLIITVSNDLSTLRSRVDIGPPSLSLLQSRSDESAGARQQGIDTRALVVVIIGAASFVVGLVSFIVSLKP